MNIISENSKTGYSINFPIEQTCDKSCPFYQDRTCYGFKGRFLIPSVKEANEARLALYNDNPHRYFEQLLLELLRLTKKGVTHIRINGIGDTPDKWYRDALVEVAVAFPELQFWVATRKAFWQDIDLPTNVTVRYSDGVEGDLTSNVTTDVETVTCPATLKGSGVHDCATCGHLCWSKRMLNVTYAKH